MIMTPLLANHMCPTYDQSVHPAQRPITCIQHQQHTTTCHQHANMQVLISSVGDLGLQQSIHMQSSPYMINSNVKPFQTTQSASLPMCTSKRAGVMSSLPAILTTTPSLSCVAHTGVQHGLSPGCHNLSILLHHGVVDEHLSSGCCRLHGGHLCRHSSWSRTTSICVCVCACACACVCACACACVCVCVHVCECFYNHSFMSTITMDLRNILILQLWPSGIEFQWVDTRPYFFL